jgi:hypothetical protein
VTLKFSDLNPVGRAIIVVVAALTAAVAGVAFATSYGALYAFIKGTGLYDDTGRYADRLNQAWPLLLDAMFIIAQLAAILGGILRGPRGWPILTMLLSGSLTVWFNLQHAGADPGRRLAAALPPVFMMLAFEIDVQIVRWVMRALGKPMEAATALPPGAVPAPFQLPSPGAVPGALYRPDNAPYGMVPPGVSGYGPGLYGPPALYGQMPSWAPSQFPRSGQPLVDADQADQAEATKRQQVEAYLAGLSAGEVARLDALGPRAAARELEHGLTERGVAVSVRYVEQILDEWNAARRGSGNGAGPGAAARKPRKS